MGRLARAVAVDVPHHITHRGNRKQDVFFCDADWKRYLDWLAEYSQKYGLEVLAYSLMSNHVHIVGTPRNETAMARTIQVAHTRHSKAINYSQACTGHLWHGRYFSCALDERHLHMAIRYVEQNPVRAGMVEFAEDYPWSSAACHCGLTSNPVLTRHDGWDGPLEDWPELLHQVPVSEDIEELRARTRTGIPCGDEEFVAKLSDLTGHPLTPRPRGRPRKPE